MAHPRIRYLLKQVIHDLKWSRVVSVLGMRQVGKTTLIKELARSYFSFDDSTTRNAALENNWSFLEGKAFPIAIDESQMVPACFSQVKLKVDQNKRPGQYLLTGSVRFLSKRDIKESLTGRTSILELLPMNLSELHQLPLSQFFHVITKNKSQKEALRLLEKNMRFTRTQVELFIKHGGLPGICFKRDAIVRDRLWEIHLETILSRDINLVAPSKLGFIKIRKLLSETLKFSSISVNKAMLAKMVGTSGPTVNRLLDAFESLYLIKKHGSTYYPTDLGLDCYLSRTSDHTDRAFWLKALYTELRTQLEYGYRAQYDFSEAQTRGGIHIPFLIELKRYGHFSIVFDAEPRSSDKSLKSLTWYKKKIPKMVTIAVHLGTNGYVSSAGHLCIPVHWIF